MQKKRNIGYLQECVPFFTIHLQFGVYYIPEVLFVNDVFLGRSVQELWHHAKTPH
jgi:hypothetical protein